MTAALPVAVLGAGIMGSATALHLTRRGVPVTLFDQEPVPFAGASRWNEGKIHLGFLYAADPTLATARAVLDGGLDFCDQVRRLTGVDPAGAVTPHDDLYLVHRDSVVPCGAVRSYFDEVAALVRSHPRAGRYPASLSGARVVALSPAELGSLADRTSIVAGFRVPERSVDTNVVADAFVAALTEARVEFRPGTRVTAVRPADGDAWLVESDRGRHGPFSAVVNALWSGRPAVDRAAGFPADRAPHHRYRVALFVRADPAPVVPSAVVAVGPFGDLKNYGGGTFYLSWYPAGLLASAEAVSPPPVPLLDDRERARIAAATFSHLGDLIPVAREIERTATRVRVAGGWVYARGTGTLHDPGAALHRRHRFGIRSRGTYHTVDTGKYSVAPTLAEEIARRITGE